MTRPNPFAFEEPVTQAEAVAAVPVLELSRSRSLARSIASRILGDYQADLTLVSQAAHEAMPVMKGSSNGAAS